MAAHPARHPALPQAGPGAMPALRVFGRRWHIASDDLPLPAAVLAVFHFVWAVSKHLACPSACGRAGATPGYQAGCTLRYRA